MITQGRSSLLLFHDRSVRRIRLPRVEAQDTTGAGDILGGAFVATYAREQEPVWSACVGVAAATLAVTRRGLGKIPPRPDVLALAERLKTTAGRNV
jgi:ribokinase